MLNGDGFPIVKVNGWQWVMDCRCLVPAPGEEPDDISMCFSIVIDY